MSKKHARIYGCPGRLPETNIAPDYTKEQLELILDSTADAIYGIDTEGSCTFCNKSCVKLLGYNSAGDLLGQNMHKKIHYSRPDGSPYPVEECMVYNAIKKGRGFDVSEEVFWRADGTSFDVEYHSYPQIINGKIVGGVITFNDITEKKKKEEEIRYLSCHDELTGLFNRRCFEKALVKMDVEENLPLSVIFADINGLKMTNDIFGHSAGDRLIKKTAEILKESCMANDIIARVGGDEFVILLPVTPAEDAQKIIERIRSGFHDAKIEAIKCSTSIGSYTKTAQDQSLEIVIGNAENAMYKDKTINRQSVSREIINTLVETLHSKKPDEKSHSVGVSELCGRMGAAMNLPETEISKLKRAGYLHDIGKIVIDDSVLLKSRLANEEEEKMRPHAVTGYRILNLFDDTLDLAEYVYGHHERWDGTGYPRGLKGEQIPLISRIIAIAECYDRWANSTDGSDEEKKAALEKIKMRAGRRFDPDLTKKFIDMIENDNTTDSNPNT